MWTEEAELQAATGVARVHVSFLATILSEFGVSVGLNVIIFVTTRAILLRVGDGGVVRSSEVVEAKQRAWAGEDGWYGLSLPKTGESCPDPLLLPTSLLEIRLAV